MIVPLPSRYDAVYFNGRTAARQASAVHLDPEGMTIAPAGVEPMWWPYAEVSLAAGGGHGAPAIVEHRSGPPGECVVVEEAAFAAALRQHAPDRFRPSRVESLYLGGWGHTLAAAAAVAAIAAGLYFWGLRWAAEAAASHLPAVVERRLGGNVARYLAPEAARCTDAGPRKLLDRVAQRLSAEAENGTRFEVIYTSSTEVNAFAAPGGYIIVYRGLLELAESPEELAGVLAHEMQHVERRHSARAIAREMSARTLLSMLSADYSGTPAAVRGAVLLGDLRYQRSDEDEADRGSVELLARAGVRADALALFLRRMDKKAGTDPMPYLSTHPQLAERAAAVEKLAREKAAPARPLLTTGEWEAARAICR